ncbi:hypothetical protein GCM10023322_59560 [Rugosimonospora acidiphila]|uniref:DUF3592 domain-containing protein n=1 Tax=Rugosimonospora acidiphila TaxID=556531 RepID=A0ABP9SFL6_9ACTN
MLIELVVFSGIWFAGMLAGGYLGYELLPRLDGGHNVGIVLAVFGISGVLGGIVVCHKARGWMMRLRLRGCTESATATVRWTRSFYGPRGGSSHNIVVEWEDAAGEHAGERQYRFVVTPSAHFTKRVELFARVPVRYPAGRPQRFIIDIPYASTMADLFI